jgi:hypothetical protein
VQLVVAQLKQGRKHFMKQPAETLNAKSLLDKLRLDCRDEREVRNRSRLSRATIWRIDQGEEDFDALTLGKLVKALSE